MLPSLRTLAADLDLDLDDEDRDRRVDGVLARGVSSLRLSASRSGGCEAGALSVPEEERRKHAELIRDMLVAINADYKRRYGTPPPERRDVEMSVA